MHSDVFSSLLMIRVLKNAGATHYTDVITLSPNPHAKSKGYGMPQSTDQLVAGKDKAVSLA